MTPDLAIHTNDIGRIYKLRGARGKDEARELVALKNVNVQVQRGEGFGWVLLILGLVLGVAGMTAFGQILGAITMQMAKHFYQVGDSVAGALFLLCGTIFPLTELPGIVRWIGYLLQPTYWLEIMRRALLGTPPDSLTSFSTWSDAALLGMLALLTAVLIGLSVRVYAWSVDQAREKGILDMETNY